MCRIAGIVSATEKTIDPVRVKLITDTMWRGGPDGSGYWCNESQQVCLGHRRLSVIDLSEQASQPFHSASGRYSLVFNGEIYNYLALKKYLENRGHKFYTCSDTEVFLSLYIEHGIDAFHKMEGMWSAAIWDEYEQSLIIVRDRIGVKPLYYSLKNNEIIFSSELKGILADPAFSKQININAIQYYFLLGYFPRDLSPLDSVSKLLPGHYLKYSRSQPIQISSWWDCRPITADIDWNNAREILDELESRLISSFLSRTVSDVPLGIFLSGGIDSSLVAAILTKACGLKLDTFTAAFPEADFDESPRAASIAQSLGLKHYINEINFHDAQSLLEILPSVWCEPLADSSCIPTFLLSKYASAFVKVVLSADGGDELFGGYPKYWLSSKRSKYLGILKPALQVSSKALSNYSSLSLFPLNLLKAFDCVDSAFNAESSTFLFSQNLFTRREVSSLLVNTTSSFSLIADLWEELSHDTDIPNHMMRYDIRTYLTDDILAKVDRASMYNGVEAREPFLATPLIDFALSMPSSIKIPFMNSCQSKNPLRVIQQKYLSDLPVDSKKRGFAAPLCIWLTRHGQDLLDKYLSKRLIDHYSFLDYDYVCKVRRQFDQNPSYNLRRIWCILTFQMWCEKWF